MATQESTLAHVQLSPAMSSSRASQHHIFCLWSSRRSKTPSVEKISSFGLCSACCCWAARASRHTSDFWHNRVDIMFNYCPVQYESVHVNNLHSQLSGDRPLAMQSGRRLRSHARSLSLVASQAQPFQSKQTSTYPFLHPENKESGAPNHYRPHPRFPS